MVKNLKIEKELNPDAFPSFYTLEGGGFGDRREVGIAGGMSLRDYFAGKALQGIMIPEYNEEYMATMAYRMADAMLKERSK